ncbi:carbohydrate ABC transporter permease [Treponema socranskii]|uniref:carbohydrate ABC transporter permease n=1 Tax=Treponema socranskii TaxID=53419 RepID=UPI0023F2A4E6|nr:sugar ABC transporter permease [Treponema socranskii]
MKFADKKKNALLYASFVGPSVLFFVLVFIVPLLYGFYLTLTDWDGIASSIGFTGFSNYVEVFTDLSFWQSMRRTILYSAASVIAINVIAFLLAYLLTSGVKAESFLRAGFFTPNLIGGLILGYIWQFVFSRVFVNIYKIIPVALFEKSWLSSPGTAMASLIIVATWQYSGYMLLIYIAGFVGIPHDLIEAARIDGAGEGLITRKIRIPLMVPSIVISLFLSITRTFKVYDVNLSLTAGGPYDSTKLAAMHIYSKAFEEQRYGVGQAEALVMFVCMAAIALTQTYIGKKRELEM